MRPILKILSTKGRGNRKGWTVFAFFILTLFFACSIAPRPGEKTPAGLVVLHTNDHHGHPVKFFQYPAPDVGGLPARATLIRRIKEENRAVLVLDAGELIFDGTPDRAQHDTRVIQAYLGSDADALAR